MVPEVYSKDISGVKTTGDFEVKGFLKGIIDDKHIPTFNIELASNSASFNYPELPNTIHNINLNATLINTTGFIDDTEINIERLSCKIDENSFTSSAQITNPIDTQE